MISIDGGRTWMIEETGFGPAVTMWLQIVKATREEIPVRLYARTRSLARAAALKF